MSHRVYKYPLVLTSGWQDVEMPDRAWIVHVHEQDRRPCLWASVDPTRHSVVRRFGVFATGEDIPTARYTGTVHVGWTVWHVYELVGEGAVG